MSLASWKKEFYPITAKKASEKSEVEAIEHSLKKWQGLTEENLEKHGLKKWGLAIKGIGTDQYLDIDDTSCALCEKYYNENVNEEIDDPCIKCPIYLSSKHTCHKQYGTYVGLSDPAQMIELLKETLEWSKTQ
jgi:hypothetical protein